MRMQRVGALLGDFKENAEGPASKYSVYGYRSSYVADIIPAGRKHPRGSPFD